MWQLAIWAFEKIAHNPLDENDYARHMDYIHYNPLKHGVVTAVKDWKYSTFHRYVDQGHYPNDWAGHGIDGSGSFGE